MTTATLSQPLSYSDRLERLKQTKLRQTRQKRDRNGYMDRDDHGTAPLPDGFSWSPIANHSNGSFYRSKGWAANFKSLMEVHPVYVDANDALAGRWMVYLSSYRRCGWFPDADFSHLKPEQELYGILSGIGAQQHFGPDYRIGLALGWGGLLAKVRRCHQDHGLDKSEFYEAEQDVIVGVQDWIRRTVAAINEAESVETDPTLKANLHEMAAVNEWLVDGPPRTLREACQWLAWYCMVSRIYNGDGAGGQLDELLRPYYERDIAAGRIDDEEAIFTLACLLLNDPHYHQIGGPGADGRDMTSLISFLIVEAGRRLGIPCNLTIRVHDGLDPDLFNLGVRTLLEDKKGWPRFSGEKGLTEGFMRNGYSEALARERIAVGCHWMAIPGREYTVNDCVKINAAKVFEVAFKEMMRESETVVPSVSRLWSLFAEHLRRAVLCTAKGLDFHLAHQKDNAPELLINLLCDGPIERGLDASAGGVDMYNLCVDGSALATVADSFAALEQRIERERKLSWAEVARHLSEDYRGEGGERVRLMLRSGERYGQGTSLGDDCAIRISELFTGLIRANLTPEGRLMIPGWFSWSSTIPMGRVVGATPNGRHAGAPISHGANPDPGFRKDAAPTAMAHAIAAIQPGYGNTAPMQLELDPGLARDRGAVDALGCLIKTHFDEGGTLINVNILDADQLRAAHKDPDAFPDLVVRVTGFTAYFASLSPEFRQLVVDRLIEA